MEFNAVYHQASDNYCYPLNEDELIINIKTGYDVKSVSIILGDPFAAGILGGGEHWDGRKTIIYKKRLKKSDLVNHNRASGVQAFEVLF